MALDLSTAPHSLQPLQEARSNLGRRYLLELLVQKAFRVSQLPVSALKVTLPGPECAACLSNVNWLSALIVSPSLSQSPLGRLLKDDRMSDTLVTSHIYPKKVEWAAAIQAILDSLPPHKVHT